MKKIKYKKVGLGIDFSPEIFDILSERYELIECEDPDYVICSVFDNPYEYCKYPQVRLFISGENYTPDFNLVDYAIGYDDIHFEDRFCNHKDCFCEDYNKYKRILTVDDVRGKEYFANFIIGHESENCIRGDFFKELSKYKRVESPGRFMNNMPDGLIIGRDRKLEFQSKTKFTICFESTSYNGFCTEKLKDAFLANTIPIYFGDPHVTRIFNPNAFIICNGREDFTRTIEKVISLDKNDDYYLDMVNQPMYQPNVVEEHYKELREFLFHIFDQPYEEAYRRSQYARADESNKRLYNAFNVKKSSKELIELALKNEFAKKFPKAYCAYKRIVKK